MEPIVVEFEVEVSPAHAFDVWTSRPTLWWPRSHTVTQDPDLVVVFEPFPGGRIYERGPDGSEHEWGEILVWDPPARVGYLWHLFFDRSEATEITVTFTGTGTGSRVKLVQTGFERLGDEVGRDRRTRTSRAWIEVTGRYRSALTGSGG
jgi:hypothetical protein